MVDLLGDLGEHMLPGTGGGGTPGFGWGDISTTPLNSLFDTASFLEKAEQVSRPFVEALSKSQGQWHACGCVSMLTVVWICSTRSLFEAVVSSSSALANVLLLTPYASYVIHRSTANITDVLGSSAAVGRDYGNPIAAVIAVWKQRRLKIAGAAAAAAAAAAREGEGGVLAASAAIAAAVAELDATPVSAQVRRQQLGLGASNGTNGGGASPAGGAAPVRVTPCDLLAVVERSSSCISDSGSSCWCNLCALTAMTCSVIQRTRRGVYKGVQRSTPVWCFCAAPSGCCRRLQP
eukprot:10767-Heterococcus_DN1.PRE.1